jgi:hypothetical protein
VSTFHELEKDICIAKCPVIFHIKIPFSIFEKKLVHVLTLLMLIKKPAFGYGSPCLRTVRSESPALEKERKDEGAKEGVRREGNVRQKEKDHEGSKKENKKR